jgi:hypothetical protein
MLILCGLILLLTPMYFDTIPPRNYDVNAASSIPGPNAPLSNVCGTSSQPTATAEAAFKQWTAAGFPAAKLLLGLPLYGYVSRSSKTSLSGLRGARKDSD